MGQQASSRWATTDGPRGAAYDERFARLAASGEDVHGEATFVAGFQPRSVLDAGCGTGRVAMELRRRGIESVGVDADRGMLAAAVARDPDGEWLIGDISTLVIADDTAEARRFDVVVAAGNVMIFLAPGTETATVANLAAHLVPGGADLRVSASGRALPARLLRCRLRGGWIGAGGTLEHLGSTGVRPGRWLRGGGAQAPAPHALNHGI